MKMKTRKRRLFQRFYVYPGGSAAFACPDPMSYKYAQGKKTALSFT